MEDRILSWFDRRYGTGWEGFLPFARDAGFIVVALIGLVVAIELFLVFRPGC